MQPVPSKFFTRRGLLASALALPHALSAAATVYPITVITHQPRFYHAWPTLLRRRNGELIVAYSGGREGHVCPFGRVEIIRSNDNGQNWSWSQVVMDTPIDDRDAGVAETPKGTLLVSTFTSLAFEKPFQEAKGWSAERTERWQSVYRATTPEQRQSLIGSWLVRSTDGGLTWSSPYRVPVMAPHGPVATPSGRLLYAGVEYTGGSSRRVGVWESTDDGLTWQWLAPIPGRESDNSDEFHELHIVEAANGHLVAQVRNHNAANNRETLQSESADGGRTWSVVHPIGVWGLPSHLLRLRDGNLLMTYGYRRAPRGNHARLSRDNGKTWSEPVILSNDGTGDLGYPSTAELASGDLLTVWYEHRLPGTTPEKVPDGPLSVLRQARWRLKS